MVIMIITSTQQKKEYVTPVWVIKNMTAMHKSFCMDIVFMLGTLHFKVVMFE